MCTPALTNPGPGSIWKAILLWSLQMAPHIYSIYLVTVKWSSSLLLQLLQDKTPPFYISVLEHTCLLFTRERHKHIKWWRMDVYVPRSFAWFQLCTVIFFFWSIAAGSGMLVSLQGFISNLFLKKCLFIILFISIWSLPDDSSPLCSLVPLPSS